MELNKLKELRRNLLLLAMVELIFGLFMIVFNANSLEMLLRLLGIIAAAYGIITFLAWLLKKEKTGAAGVIVTAVLGVVTGAFLIFFISPAVLSVFTLISGIFAGILGVIKLPHMFSVKKAGFKKWFILLIPIAIMIALGIVIGLNTGFSNSVTSVLLGVVLILACAADVIAMAGASGVEKNIDSSMPVEAEAEFQEKK